MSLLPAGTFHMNDNVEKDLCFIGFFHDVNPIAAILCTQHSETQFHK